MQYYTVLRSPIHRNQFGITYENWITILYDGSASYIKLARQTLELTEWQPWKYTDLIGILQIFE